MREGLTIVLATVAACAAAAGALSLARGADYEATAVVSRAPAGAALRSLPAAQAAVGAQARELLGRLDAERMAGGEAAFTLRAPEPEAARRLVGGYAREWARSGGSSGAVPVVRVGPARRERDTLRAALLGGGVGLLAGLLLALVREGLDVRRTSSRSVAGRLGLEELGRVPEAVEAHRLPPPGSSDGDRAEGYARLAERVYEHAREESARALLVCGTVAEDRGEQVAAELAVALAADGRRVAVVELDPTRPALRRHFALPRGAGAAELANGGATLDEVLAEAPGAGTLAVLTAGAGPAPGREAAEALLQELRRRFDAVILAGPPLLAPAGRARANGSAVAGVDALVLAVALRRTRRSRRPRVERALVRLGVPPLGFVLVASAGGGRFGSAAASADRAPDLAAGGGQARHHDRQQED